MLLLNQASGEGLDAAETAGCPEEEEGLTWRQENPVAAA